MIVIVIATENYIEMLWKNVEMNDGTSGWCWYCQRQTAGVDTDTAVDKNALACNEKQILVQDFYFHNGFTFHFKEIQYLGNIET